MLITYYIIFFKRLTLQKGLKSTFFSLLFSFSFFISTAQNKIQDSALALSIYESDYNVPPPSFTCSNAIKLEDCIKKLCNANTSQTDNYKVMLYETNECYAVILFPENNKKDSGSNPHNKVESYYSLSKEEFKGFQFMGVVQKIRSQFSNFSKTNEFVATAIAKSKTLSIKFDDGYILRIKQKN